MEVSLPPTIRLEGSSVLPGSDQKKTMSRYLPSRDYDVCLLCLVPAASIESELLPLCPFCTTLENIVTFVYRTKHYDQGFPQFRRQLSGNFAYFEQLFFPSSNFLHSEQFLVSSVRKFEQLATRHLGNSTPRPLFLAFPKLPFRFAHFLKEQCMNEVSGVVN